MSEVNVLSRSQLIVVNPTTRSVSVINAGPQGPGGIQGLPGEDGDPGAQGPPGPGVAPGGAAGQMLTKIDETNFNTQWVTPVTNLDSISNVNAPTAVDGQALVYDNATSMWVPRTVATGGGLPAGGVIYDLLVKASSAPGDAVWSAVPQVNTLTTNLIHIRDLAGALYPKLTFGSGDGNNGVNPNPYEYWFEFINDKLLLYSGRAASKALMSWKRLASNEAEFTLHDWTVNSHNDGYLRFFYGSDKTVSEMFLSQGGALNLVGAVTAPNFVGTYFGDQVNAYMRSTDHIELQSYGSIGAPQCILFVGAQFGSGSAGKVSIMSYPPGNDWTQRPLTLSKQGGAGECAIAFANHVTGWTAGFQLHATPGIYIGAVNGANSANIEMKASAFTVVSSKRFKTELENINIERIRTAIEQLVPIRYRDLQHEMAMTSDARLNKSLPLPELPKRYRFGMIAEEVEEILPELVSDSMHGPGIDLSGMIGVLWKAVQDLSARLKEFEDAGV
jgi:hypothetical protein